MVFNKSMHPRNIYKTPPDFKQLALDYPEFRKHAIQDIAGKVHINFKDPDSLRSLTRTLLKKDFGLEVEIPADRLIPTVPQRLNYILWVEDLIKDFDNTPKHGVDIGTGASCIFPLIGGAKNGWSFLATESDQASYECALRNVKNNKLDHLVKVIHVNESSLLHKTLTDNSESIFDFSMCNPPFFCDNFDASWESKSRKKTRGEPSGSNTAAEKEIITKGGEVEFVEKIILSSLVLKDRVKIYTTMLGKKTSVGAIKDLLRENNVPHFVSTEFQQGKTLRWGIAWTFCPNLKLSKVAIPKAAKPIKPTSFFVPSTIKDAEYSVFGVLNRIKELLTEASILFHVHQEKPIMSKLWMRSNKNTWSHQRRKKRELMRQEKQKDNEKDIGGLTSQASDKINGEQNTANQHLEISSQHSKRKRTDSNEEVACNENDVCSENPCGTKTEQDEACGTILKKSEKNDAEKWLLFVDLEVSLVGRCIMIELKPRRQMENREALHQIMQFFKNKLL